MNYFWPFYYRWWITMFLEVTIFPFNLLFSDYFVTVSLIFLPFKICRFAGKLNRGLSVIDSYKLVKEGKELTSDEIFLACALGWCIEWVWRNNKFHCFLYYFFHHPFDYIWYIHSPCSSRPIFLFLMISWTAQRCAEADHVGSEYQRSLLY